MIERADNLHISDGLEEWTSSLIHTCERGGCVLCSARACKLGQVCRAVPPSALGLDAQLQVRLAALLPSLVPAHST